MGRRRPQDVFTQWTGPDDRRPLLRQLGVKERGLEMWVVDWVVVACLGGWVGWLVGWWVGGWVGGWVGWLVADGYMVACCS